MASSMRAVVLSAPGPVENLQIRHLPLPEPEPGWVRIKVEAFGLNRSELHTRLGLAEGVIFPRVLGIECVGLVDRRSAVGRARPRRAGRQAGRPPVRGWSRA
jgi:NADPH:quinone reductase-like Zn-dependent oxidoreductase